MENFKLWEAEEQSELFPNNITAYLPERKTSDVAVVIFPGGGYGGRAPHEGRGYAEFLNEWGISAFVVDYRVRPNTFPLPLLDARRAVRFVRANAKKFGIDPNKIAVMGSSAGGHLAAFVSTYRKALEGEGVDALDTVDYLPNAQILCYPVITWEPDIAHQGSYLCLLGKEKIEPSMKAYSPELLADEKTPQAFLWHTANDPAVNVINSYMYATALRKLNIPVEMHIFPNGPHGMGAAKGDPHIAQWTQLLRNWITNFIK